MYILKDFQENKVLELLNHTYEALAETQRQIPLLLEAPTGAGKTVMMAAYIERLVSELPLRPGLPAEVAFVWFAPNTLHIQSYESLTALYADTQTLNCLDLGSLSTNPALAHRDLLFVNWSSVDSTKKIWRRDNEHSTNLETLVENTRADSVEIILIIDEAHLSAFTGKQAVAVRRLIGAKLEISVTATPLTRPRLNVSISRRQVVDEQMIKKGVRLNIGLDPDQQNGENVHMHLLRVAWAKKQELTRLYAEELGPNVINPLLLIQLPSDNASLSDDDKKVRDIVVALLESELGITTDNGRLAIWLSGEKNKDGLEEANGLQDVLLFKQAIAQGWNCPRATILLNYRTIQSPSFGIQTVGRILRMPHQRHYQHDDLNYGYVYSNIPSSQINFVPSDQDFIHIQHAVRRQEPGLVFDRLSSATIVNDRISPGVLSSEFEAIFYKIMERHYDLEELPDVNLFTGDPDEFDDLVKQNRGRMKARLWEFTIDEHQVPIPTDIEVDPYAVNSIVVGRDQIKHFSVTQAEFDKMLDKYCYDSIRILNRSKSWKTLRRTLIQFAEYYLNINEFEARKVFLHPQNQTYLNQHITEALEEFAAWQNLLGNSSRRPVTAEWTVPEYRYYSTDYEAKKSPAHSLKPFYELSSASNPEKLFAEFLDAQAEHLEWWYKNGDSGKEHFSVPYHDSAGVLRAFFVDFVVKLKSGGIALFDTKTKKSDSESPNKHNALLDYLEKENAANTSRQLIGGVLIPEETAGSWAFRYCRNRITATDDLTGWEFFNPGTVDVG